MTRIEKSDAQLDAEADVHTPDVRPCAHCSKPYLDGFPHRHETPPQPGYDPMPDRPASVVGMIAVIRREYRLELPSRLHVTYVPSRAEPIGVSEYSMAAAGFVTTTVDVLDAGELGSPPWSPSFHRRVGAVTQREGEQTIEEGDWSIFPWAFAIEHRLDRWCRSRHGNRPELWREHRGQPICRPMVELVVKHNYTVEMAGLEYGMTSERAESLLDEALRRVWGQVSNQLNRLPMAA